WEGLSCSRIPGIQGFDVVFHGDKGVLALSDRGYTIYEPEKGKEVKKVPGARTTDAAHVGNFLGAIRGDTKLNSEIEEGHKSTLLCHLGNIAYRVGRALTCDPKTRAI